MFCTAALPGNYSALLHITMNEPDVTSFLSHLLDWFLWREGQIGRLFDSGNIKKNQIKSLLDNKCFRFLKHCSFGKGIQGEIAGMVQQHLNSPLIY